MLAIKVVNHFININLNKYEGKNVLTSVYTTLEMVQRTSWAEYLTVLL